MLSALSHWLRRATRPTPARRPNRNTPIRPRLEALEDRCVPAVLFVTKTLDDISVPGTLRYEVAHAKSGDTIDILTASPIALTKGELLLSKNLTIEATGKQAVISGSGMSRVFTVDSGAHVELVNLELIHGNGRDRIPTFPQSFMPLFAGDGGAILNLGSLTVSKCVLAANSAQEGGAVFNEHGQVFFSWSIVSSNAATDDGGAVYNDHGSLVVSHCNVFGDTAAAAGGAVFNRAGAVTVADSLLSHDLATFGGGIYTDGGSLTLLRDTLSHEAAKVDGGGVYNHASSLTVSHCKLSFDTAGAFGGGIFTSGGTAVLVSDLVTHDSAGVHGGGVYHTAAGTLKISFSTAIADTPEARFGSYINGGGNVGF
jgi:hypothetical protein